MAAFGDHLYLTTWDVSTGVQQFSLVSFLDKLFNANYGFDMYRTSDGIHWTALTRTGLGDPNNSGGRSLEATPFGLFIGTTRQRAGLQIFRTTGPPPEAQPLPPPMHLTAAREADVGRTTLLTWEPSPGAVGYQVYRALVMPLKGLFGGAGAPDGSGAAGAVAGIGPAGVLASIVPQSTVAAEATPIDVAAFPLGFRVIAQVTATEFAEPAPTVLQSLYFVRAVDAQGNLSAPSNFVGAPSKAAPSPATLRGR
jgi:hypothetical protein